ALLRTHARPVAHRWEDRRTDRLLRVSARDPATAARSGGARIRHSALERDAERGSLRGARTTRRAGARDTRVLPPPGVNLQRARYVRNSSTIRSTAPLPG